MSPDELRAAVDYLDACLRDLNADADGNLRDLSPDEQTRFDEGLALRERYAADLVRHARVAGLAPVAQPGDQRTAPNINSRRDPLEVAEDRSATPTQIGDAVRAAVEAQVGDGERMERVDQLLRQQMGRNAHRDDVAFYRDAVVRSTDVYEDAWAKYMTGRELTLSEEERTALSVGSSTNGGYLLPTHLDPTIILTNVGTSNAIRGIARVVTLGQGFPSWNGVTSAGVTASWDGELTEVSDDTPTFGRVTITPKVAQAFVHGSIASFDDIAGLQSDVMMLFADAKDRLEGAAHATGVGTGSTPKGVFTAINAVSGQLTTSTTAATIGLVDIHATYRALGVRWRSQGKWLTNPLYSTAVKALGSAVSASYSGDLRDPVSTRWLDKPVIESDDAPTTQTTTALDNEILFGDFSNYVIVDKIGLSVEFIPHLFAVANNLPDGRRGWYAYWRTAADVVNTTALVMLVDRTSA